MIHKMKSYLLFSTHLVLVVFLQRKDVKAVIPTCRILKIMESKIINLCSQENIRRFCYSEISQVFGKLLAITECGALEVFTVE